jgi:hypothetical protein
MSDAMGTPLTVAGAGLVRTGPCELRGFSLRSSVAASVTLFDNTAGSGLILATFDTIAGSLGSTLVLPGLYVAVGLFLTTSAGTLSGSVWIA